MTLIIPEHTTWGRTWLVQNSIFHWHCRPRSGITQMAYPVLGFSKVLCSQTFCTCHPTVPVQSLTFSVEPECNKNALRPGSNAVLHMSLIDCKLTKRIMFAHLHSIRLMWSMAFEPGLRDKVGIPQVFDQFTRWRVHKYLEQVLLLVWPTATF